MKKQKTNLAARLEHEKTSDYAALPILSIQILKMLKKYNRLTISETIKHTGANQDTLKARLRELVSIGHIQRYGKAKATWYSYGKE